MKRCSAILRCLRGTDSQDHILHHLWLAFALTGLGCAAGLVTLALSATAYPGLDSAALFGHYLSDPAVLAVNLLPPVLVMWTVYFLTRRAWLAFAAGYIPAVLVALVNYFKIRLRGDPMVAADLKLAGEAGNIVAGYTLDMTWLVWFAIGAFFVGLLFAVLLMPNGIRGWKERLFGTAACLALCAVAMSALYFNPRVYEQTAAPDFVNDRSDVEAYVGRGCLYPFLHTFRTLFAGRPAGYSAEDGAALLASFTDADIPEGQKVSVLGIMLEAFCDLTDLPALGEKEAVRRVYAPWHALEEQSVSGELLTNIFAGGTVDTEWAFLTGYSTHGDFTHTTDSYVWYLREQGYQTFGSHPGFGWFYDRENVNQYLGFQDYRFTENYYGALVDPVVAQWHSDGILMPELTKELEQRMADGPCFSFSVAYQNHGPYDTGSASGTRHLTAADGLTPETQNLFNNYLNGVAETLAAVENLVADLEKMEEPVVLVLFGDHKPWAGNGNSGWTEVGAAFDLSTEAGFYEYYSTPYLIWANSAAKAVLGRDFTGAGGDFSPCFLMTEVFDRCGWEGPAFLQLSRQMRDITPLLHVRDLYWRDGLTDALPAEEQGFLSAFLSAQYLREKG